MEFTKIKLQLILALLLLQVVTAVKIGVSKIDTPRKAPKTTTPMITSTVEEELTTPITTTEEVPATSTPTTTSTSTPTTTTSTTIKTTYPSFAVPTFPTKRTVTVVKTTPTPNHTTQKPPSINETNSEVPPSADPALQLNVDNYFCSCNLLAQSCDLNCCCDPDCVSEARRVFNCYADSKEPELRSRLKDFQYQHGLPSCHINDGWLCVFRTNLQPQRQQETTFNVDTAAFYKWPREMLQSSEQDEEVEHSSTERSFYKYGAALKLLKMETSEKQNFELPFAFRPPYCHIQTPIRYLKSYQAACLQYTLEELHEQTRQILQQLTTTKLLIRPKESERTEEYLKEWRLNLCHKNTAKQEDKQKCAPLEMANLTNELELSNRYAREIRIKILHNYTSILAGAVELGVQEFSADATELWQTYAVEFVFKNTTAAAKSATNSEIFEELDAHTTPILTSGPLGYLQGEPLIIARFIAQNSSHAQSAQNQVLSYFHANATRTHQNHTLRLFTRRLRHCHKNMAKANYINYGISTHKQCELHLGNASELIVATNLEATNFTSICLRLQNRVLSQLFSVPVEADNYERLSELYISQLGKPVNASEQWTPLQLRAAEFAPVSGHFNKAAHSFTCRNILLSAAYEFHIGTFVAMTTTSKADAVAVPHQALVKNAALILGQRHDLEFTLDELVAVPLSISVMFYDLNSVGAAGAARYFAPLTGVFYVILFFSFFY